MTNQFTELEAINDQELLTTTGGGAVPPLAGLSPISLALEFPLLLMHLPMMVESPRQLSTPDSSRTAEQHAPP